MNPYNGFTGEQRSYAGAVQKLAVSEGWKPVKICEICGQHEGYIGYHLEDYDRPVSDCHPLCVECHMTLHARFRDRNRWLALLHRAEQGIKSKPYWNVGVYFSVSNAAPRPPRQEPIEYPGKWFERLDYRRGIIFRNLSEDDQALISHPPLPDWDLRYNLSTPLRKLSTPLKGKSWANQLSLF